MRFGQTSHEADLSGSVFDLAAVTRQRRKAAATTAPELEGIVAIANLRAKNEWSSCPAP